MVQSGYLSWIGKAAVSPKVSLGDWRAAVHRFALLDRTIPEQGTKGGITGEFVHHAESLVRQVVPARALFG